MTQNERTEYEKCAKSLLPAASLGREPDGAYLNSFVEVGWQVWQTRTGGGETMCGCQLDEETMESATTWPKEKIWESYKALWKDRDEQERRATRAERRVLELERENGQVTSETLSITE